MGMMGGMGVMKQAREAGPSFFSDFEFSAWTYPAFPAVFV
jgi:hypothetical protein